MSESDYGGCRQNIIDVYGDVPVARRQDGRYTILFSSRRNSHRTFRQLIGTVIRRHDLVVEETFVSIGGLAHALMHLDDDTHALLVLLGVLVVN